MVAHRKINEFQNVKTVERVLNIPRSVCKAEEKKNLAI